MFQAGETPSPRPSKYRNIFCFVFPEGGRWCPPSLKHAKSLYFGWGGHGVPPPKNTNSLAPGTNEWGRRAWGLGLGLRKRAKAKSRACPWVPKWSKEGLQAHKNTSGSTLGELSRPSCNHFACTKYESCLVEPSCLYFGGGDTMPPAPRIQTGLCFRQGGHHLPPLKIQEHILFCISGGGEMVSPLPETHQKFVFWVGGTWCPPSQKYTLSGPRDQGKVTEGVG